jgi:hypothetical protein
VASEYTSLAICFTVAGGLLIGLLQEAGSLKINIKTDIE